MALVNTSRPFSKPIVPVQLMPRTGLPAAHVFLSFITPRPFHFSRSGNGMSPRCGFARPVVHPTCMPPMSILLPPQLLSCPSSSSFLEIKLMASPVQTLLPLTCAPALAWFSLGHLAFLLVYKNCLYFLGRAPVLANLQRCLTNIFAQAGA